MQQNGRKHNTAQNISWETYLQNQENKKTWTVNTSVHETKKAAVLEVNVNDEQFPSKETEQQQRACPADYDSTTTHLPAVDGAMTN